MGNALDRNRRRGDHFAVEKSLCLKGAALRSRPTDRYAAAVATVVVDFDQRLTAALKALSRRHATSLFVTILTGWGAVLSRLSGQEALTVGAVAASPPARRMALLSGVYAETIRIDLSGEPSELRGKVGDGASQAANFISAASSIPSLNLTPSMTFGNWF